MDCDGYNIESAGDTCGFDQSTDQVDVTAEQLNLGPLQDNRGPTMTHTLGEGSVAIDVIPEVDCVDAEGAPLTTDQRGFTRPVGAECDVGALEVNDCAGVPDDTLCAVYDSPGLCLDGICLVRDCSGLENGTGCAYVTFFTSLGWCIAGSCELGDCTGFLDGAPCAFEDGTTGTCVDASCEPSQ